MRLLTLRKLTKESDGQGRKNYKNAALATLGDAVAKAVLAESLYNEGKDKGEITKEKSEKEANKQFEKLLLSCICMRWSITMTA